VFGEGHQAASAIGVAGAPVGRGTTSVTMDTSSRAMAWYHEIQVSICSPLMPSDQRRAKACSNVSAS